MSNYGCFDQHPQLPVFLYTTLPSESLGFFLNSPSLLSAVSLCTAVGPSTGCTPDALPLPEQPLTASSSSVRGRNFRLFLRTH